MIQASKLLMMLARQKAGGNSAKIQILIRYCGWSICHSMPVSRLSRNYYHQMADSPIFRSSHKTLCKFKTIVMSDLMLFFSVFGTVFR